MNKRSFIELQRRRDAICRQQCRLIAVFALALCSVASADESDSPALETKTGVRANSSSVASIVDLPSETESPNAMQNSQQPAQSPTVLSRGPSPKIERSKYRTAANNSTRTSRAFDTLWPLGVVLIIVGCCAWSAKRWMPKSMRRTVNAGGAMNILARQSLSTKQSICLVRVGRRLVLMSVSPERITALSEITDVEEVASIVAATESGRAGSFTSLFAKASDADVKSPELENEMEEPTLEDSDSLMPLVDLAHTRARVQKLLECVRGLTTNASSSAEPANRTAAAQ